MSRPRVLDVEHSRGSVLAAGSARVERLISIGLDNTGGVIISGHFAVILPVGNRHCGNTARSALLPLASWGKPRLTTT
ncbi:MAG: hypothetical protein QOF25_5542 [Mycobacterium sp.]|nr:hypothetical protein [Mycobacterium sp.]